MGSISRVSKKEHPKDTGLEVKTRGMKVSWAVGRQKKNEKNKF